MDTILSLRVLRVRFAYPTGCNFNPDSNIKLYDPWNIFFSLCYTSPVWLSTEIDGVRIISGRTLDFFQRLPNELFNVFHLMSDSPGAKLYSAYMNYKVQYIQSC
jgi:hypothetical protein